MALVRQLKTAAFFAKIAKTTQTPIPSVFGFDKHHNKNMHVQKAQSFSYIVWYLLMRHCKQLIQMNPVLSKKPIC